jgi:hypothetical protein
MRKLWQKLFEPWREFPGWEFDLLRTLPSDVATRLCRQAWRRIWPELLNGWRFWAVSIMMGSLATTSLLLVWAAAAVLGLGALGKIGLEVAFHATICVLIIHPLARHQNRMLLPYVRRALVDEMLEYVRDELAPRRRSRWVSEKTL